jgi:hypothetical protein
VLLTIYLLMIGRREIGTEAQPSVPSENR